MKQEVVGFDWLTVNVKGNLNKVYDVQKLLNKNSADSGHSNRCNIKFQKNDIT